MTAASYNIVSASMAATTGAKGLPKVTLGPGRTASAALTPAQSATPSTPPAAPSIDPADIARLLQAHLKRVGCNPGNADGNWDHGSQKALELFDKSAQTKFDVKLASLDALDAVRSKTERVCPLECSAREWPSWVRDRSEAGKQ